MAKVRHNQGTEEDSRGSTRDPRWATALVLSALAALTLVTTGAPGDVPVVLAAVIAAIGVESKVVS